MIIIMSENIDYLCMKNCVFSCIVVIYYVHLIYVIHTQILTLPIDSNYRRKIVQITPLTLSLDE